MYIVAYAGPNGTVHAMGSHSPRDAAADVNLLESSDETYGLGVQTSTFEEMSQLVLELGGVPFALQTATREFLWIAGPGAHGMFDLGVTAPWMAYVDQAHPAYGLRHDMPVTLDSTDGQH